MNAINYWYQKYLREKLTTEDIAYIVDTFYAVEGNTKEKCEEVLKRFNEKKEQS